jgi:hypothetical protein
MFFYSCSPCGDYGGGGGVISIKEYEVYLRYKKVNDSDYYTNVKYLNLNLSKTIVTSPPKYSDIIPHVITLPYREEPQTLVLNSINRTDTIIVTSSYDVISECNDLIYRRKWVRLDYTSNPAFKWNDSFFYLEN